ncbi:hypothetical protein [Lederbergia lenta]|uniref:hypothetical protein n=1 Tax=Lederbergia lenta TaxID=1467 RepID=UPI00203C6E80|nr:hypothetical protein [Lederbergia lenta]MCM3109914.1 hypothetical protein [Lederbergia lenta]
MDYIRELEIIKAALEGDIIRQKNSDKATEPAFKAWLEDSEKVLRKVSKKIMTEKAKEWYFKKER